MLFLAKIKPVIFKLTTSRGQRNLRTVFIFVSCEENGCYRIVSLGHLIFDCRSNCGLSRRMQSCACILLCEFIWFESACVSSHIPCLIDLYYGNLRVK